MNELLLAILLAANPQQTADETCKTAVTFLEARGESLRGQKAVRQVLANRARKNGTNACVEAKRKGQFSSVKPGMNLKNVKLSRKFLTQQHRVRIMPRVVPTCATSFHNKAVRPYWVRSKRIVARINNHVFYCDK